MISYAQNFEDVMIARLFDAHWRGFYVDIGAAHPDFLSITHHFYDQGWSGINVEPTFRFYRQLCGARSRDTNLQCAIGNSPGLVERTVADRLASTDLAPTPHEVEVEVVRLADLCDMHVRTGPSTS
jgi:FkbM family methyltransferase